MPEQLTFPLAPEPAATFATFVAGPNAEVVQALASFARGAIAETAVVLWGAAGAGKSHLLKAVAAEAAAAGRTALHCPCAWDVPAASPGPGSVVCVDDVERADATAQGRLFTLFNALAATGGQLAVAAAVPPAQLPLREDVRTRLGWGLVYEVVPLADEAKPAALVAFARQRGFDLPGDTIAYLLAHGPRGMSSLVGALVALDAYSLAHKRPITVPLVRAWIQRDMALD